MASPAASRAAHATSPARESRPPPSRDDRLPSTKADSHGAGGAGPDITAPAVLPGATTATQSASKSWRAGAPSAPGRSGTHTRRTYVFTLATVPGAREQLISAGKQVRVGR